MGDVIKVDFNGAKNWDETHANILNGFLKMGQACRDDPELMQLKADRFTRLLNELLNINVRVDKVTLVLPSGFRRAHETWLQEQLADAQQDAMIATIQAVCGELIDASADLCTSKLKRFPD